MKKHSSRDLLVGVLGILLSLFTLLEVNYPVLSPQSRLAAFAMLGLVLCFLCYPAARRHQERKLGRVLDIALGILAVLAFSFIFVQTEQHFQAWWLDGRSLGDRAAQEGVLDVMVGLTGLLLVLEATRRSIGWTLPVLSIVFLAYAYGGPQLPAWLLPHRGYPLDRIVSQIFLQSQGVFGVALNVMFTYVFLFILLGAFLQATGTSQFVVDFAKWCFGRGSGGPAKVAVLSSGLMGSLSGSAVANTVTTGTFTIPMMRASGFRPHLAAAVEAAASSGGALMPPVMGAGAYMMLEMVTPPVTYLQIVQAALIPALLYYLSLFFIVHFQSRKVAIHSVEARAESSGSSRPRFFFPFEGVVLTVTFFGLIGFLIAGYTPFRAVSLTLLILLLTSFLNARTRLSLRKLGAALIKTALDAVPLICASACVGTIIGVVTLTGMGSKVPALILPLAEGNLMLALMLIMVSTIILGMGLPSAISYLLMASLIGPVLVQLHIVPLAGHLFIFYFGMMSMVTPPVALAAYAAASIAGSPIMQTSWAAFRCALVGFTLPFMFVFRPQLLMMNPAGGQVAVLDVFAASAVAVLGILAFAAALSGYLLKELSVWLRLFLVVSAGFLLYPGPQLDIAGWPIALHDVAGVLLLGVVVLLNHRSGEKERPAVAVEEETGETPSYSRKQASESHESR